MNGRGNRAWQFLIPDIDAPESAAGMSVTPSGRIGMVEGDAAVRQSILLLLSTTPGERVMRPQYGCDLQRLAFAGNDQTTAGLAIHYVREAVERWEPRAEILQIDAEPSAEDPGRLDIHLEYRVRATQHTEQLTLGWNLSEGAR